MGSARARGRSRKRSRYRKDDRPISKSPSHRLWSNSQQRRWAGNGGCGRIRTYDPLTKSQGGARRSLSECVDLGCLLCAPVFNPRLSDQGAEPTTWQRTALPSLQPGNTLLLVADFRSILPLGLNAAGPAQLTGRSPRSTDVPPISGSACSRSNTSINKPRKVADARERGGGGYSLIERSLGSSGGYARRRSNWVDVSFCLPQACGLHTEWD